MQNTTQKEKWDINNSDTYLILLMFEDGKMPDVFLIPAIAWRHPNELFCDKDYEGLKSKPEYGLNLSKKNMPLLAPYKIEKAIVSILNDGGSENEILSKPDNFELYFEEEQFDEFVERLKSFKIQYVHDVAEYSWGQRVIRFYDSDMHIIEVGESMVTVVKRFIAQGLTIEETAKRTQHPVEFVKSCII